MPGNELGKVRRSAAIMNYGPGAIVDFRAGGGPVSVVAAGLEQWDERAPPAGLTNPQTVFEPRLQKKLRVDGFRLPPVYTDDGNDAQRRDAEERVELVGVRFPGWLQCPSCDVLRAARDWASEPGNPARYCPRCTAARPGGD